MRAEREQQIRLLEDEYVRLRVELEKIAIKTSLTRWNTCGCHACGRV